MQWTNEDRSLDKTLKKNWQTGKVCCEYCGKPIKSYWPGEVEFIQTKARRCKWLHTSCVEQWKKDPLGLRKMEVK